MSRLNYTGTAFPEPVLLTNFTVSYYADSCLGISSRNEKQQAMDDCLIILVADHGVRSLITASMMNPPNIIPCFAGRCLKKIPSFQSMFPVGYRCHAASQLALK